jgi:DNA invertase Pin-like site-specific DNA recombinase
VEKMKKIERVAAYIRVSTTEQKLHGLSLDAQKMKLIAYAKAHNMRIVEWYMDEGVSGRKLIRNRPELQRMIHDAQKGNFERIIFIKLDRFFRSVAEYHECMKQIAPVVWSTTEENYDLTTANGRMLVNMKLTIAEMEADQTGERIKIVNEYKTATGQPLSGSQPFGFMNAKDETTGRKKVVKDPDEAPILEEVLQHFMTYQSKRKAITYLHSKYHISMSQHAFGDLISNTMLYGAYRDNPSYCDAYIDKETFDKIQEIVKRNIKENAAENRVYLFTGLIKCPHCGRLLAGQISTSSRKGKIYKYKAYRCPKHRMSNACDFKKVIFEGTFEKMLLENLEQYIEDAKIRSVEITDSGEDKVLKYDIDELNAELERLNYAWKKGRIKGGIEEYDREYDELTEKIELAKLEKENTEPKDFSKIESVLHEGWREIYKALDDEHKRAFWRGIISSIEVEWHDKIKRIEKVNFL